MQVSQLVIEVGRKCNLSCAHCLRGKSQDVTVDVDTVKKLINEFEFIGNITFTGGEPTLYSKEICEIIDYIVDNEKQIASFYIASNGTIFDADLMLKLCKFYGYVDEYFDGTEVSAFDLSEDQFHTEINSSIKSLYKAFSFVTSRGNIADTGVINEGNASYNGIGYRSVRSDISFYYEEDIDTVEMIYLNAKGYILPDCNYSYETQDYMEPYKYGEVPLKTIIKKFNAVKAA